MIAPTLAQRTTPSFCEGAWLNCKTRGWCIVSGVSVFVHRYNFLEGLFSCVRRYDFLEGKDFCAWCIFSVLTFGYDFLEGMFCGGSDSAISAYLG